MRRSLTLAPIFTLVYWKNFSIIYFVDLAKDFGENALIGKSHTFKDIFFVPPKYAEMLKRPYARIEKKTMIL